MPNINQTTSDAMSQSTKNVTTVLAASALLGACIFGMRPTLNAVWSVVAIALSLLSAARDLVVMISSIVLIVSEAFIELAVSSLKLFANIVKFMFILLKGTLNILWELSPLVNFLVQCVWTLVLLILAPIKYVLLLPVTFSAEIGNFMSRIYCDVCEGLTYCKDGIYDLFQNLISQKEMVSRVCSDILSSIGDFAISIQTFMTHSFNFIISTIRDVFVHFTEVFTIFFEKVVTMPSHLRQDMTILVICGALTLALAIFEIRKRRRAGAVERVLHANAEPPLPNEWESEESDASDYALFDDESRDEPGDQCLPDDAPSLQRLLEDERDQRLCVVCQDRHKSVVLIPCRHLCLCDPCAREITRYNVLLPNHRRECPLCRHRIDKIIPVYT